MSILKNNVKGIFLDIGWTLCYPVTGDWVLPLKFFEYVDRDCWTSIPESIRLEAFRKAAAPVETCHLLHSCKEEQEQFKAFYKSYFSDLPGISLTEKQIEEITLDHVYNMDNYPFYEGVPETVAMLKERYKVGVISDCWPSARLILDRQGVYDLLDSVTFSCHLGVFKPDKRMFEHALKEINLAPEFCVFVDDFIINLNGAAKAGIGGVHITAKPGSDVTDVYPQISIIRQLL